MIAYVSTWYDMMFVYGDRETPVGKADLFYFENWTLNKYNKRAVWRILNSREVDGKTKVKLLCVLS